MVNISILGDPILTFYYDLLILAKPPQILVFVGNGFSCRVI